jgi:uncharacterized protein
MIYKPFKDISLSRLGMGNMRLPTIGEGRSAAVDRAQAQKIIDYAISHGINYFDTAYVYHGGDSEKFLGEALKKYPRSSYYIATKYMAMGNPDYKAVFEEQLKRLDTDYIDFYLLHGMFDMSIDTYLNGGCIDYFMEQKTAGRIKYFGFSSHASVEALERVAAFREWDFAQIQLNYLDWIAATAKSQYEILTKHNIPIMVMEPVRGGRLASLSPEADSLLKKAQPEWSVASWAFRWIMRLPNVQVILSGMSNMEQITDNVATFDDGKMLTDAQEKQLMDACELFRSSISVPCTACRYCCDTCPQGLDIPKLMEAYNSFKLNGPMSLGALYALPAGKKPADCIACGVCSEHCPQNIVIPDIMAQLTEAMKNMPKY